jgi:hypothetical protein
MGETFFISPLGNDKFLDWHQIDLRITVLEILKFIAFNYSDRLLSEHQPMNSQKKALKGLPCFIENE